MTATFTISPAPEASHDAKRYVLDCPHGRTESILFPGGLKLTDAEIAGMLLEHHYAQERCACTARLRMKYCVSIGRDQ